MRPIRTAEPYTITEDDSDITLSVNTADVATEVLSYRVPIKGAIKIKKGSRIYMYFATAAPVQQTTGVVKMYKTSSDKETHKSRILVASPDELDAGGTPEDKEKQYTIKRDIVLGPQEYLIVEANFDTVMATTPTKFRLDCVKVTEWTL